MKQLHLKLLIIAGILSLACTTKVSEWVLLNNPANEYLLVYYHKEPLSETVKQQNSKITSDIKSANVRFRSILKNDIDRTHYALIYGNRLFSKYYNPGELENLTLSPLRKKIAAELMSGKLCVMLYLKTGNDAKDDPALQIIKSTISASPFREIIPVMELDRNSVEEKHLVSMLLNVESDLKDINEPMLFGVFARFKALEPLLAKGISTENINLMIDFLTADCSCVIKEDLPGTDILFTNDWENPLPAMVNRILDENPSLLHH
ncbi:MAG TPA: hypothetical protein DDW27_21910 [Bacteroidales bacterium]|nr:hypothetical protein [Bacteroidales bacterium]